MKPFKTITLRLNAAEYEHLRKLSDITGLKMEPVLRQLIMGTTLRPKPPESYAALLREFSAIGNNVNQIARNINVHKSAERAEIEAAVQLVFQYSRLGE